jgi:hypothetical protein
MVVGFLLWFIACLIVGLCGARRKFGFWAYFVISVFLTPLIGLLVVFASDPRPPTSAP